MNLHCYPYYDPPEPIFYCPACGNYDDRCQCDRDYAEYLEAWIAAVAAGEFDTDDDSTVEMEIAA